MSIKIKTAALGAVIGLTLLVPLTGHAKEGPTYGRFDAVGATGFVNLQTVDDGYLTFDPASVHLVDYQGRRVFKVVFHFIDAQKGKDYGAVRYTIDPYRKYYYEDRVSSVWQPIGVATAARANKEGFPGAMETVLDYLAGHFPELYRESVNSSREVSEREAAEERAQAAAQIEKIWTRLQEAYPPDLTASMRWEEFSKESVDYEHVPPLSELMGHVFLLSDVYGFNASKNLDGTGGKHAVLPIAGNRRTGLVHFSVLPQGDAFMVALVDDTGAFLGEDAGRKPIITNFSSGHSQVNKYRGDREVSHDILQTYGHVLGSSNVGENFPHLVDSFVDLSIEKTDQEGVYHLVYYVTTTDPEGTSKLERIGDCYATLELMR